MMEEVLLEFALVNYIKVLVNYIKSKVISSIGCIETLNISL